MKGFDSKWYAKRTGTKTRSKAPNRVKLESRFEAFWRTYEYDEYCPFEKEHRFDSVRRFRFDFSWLNAKVALEIDGGVWLKKGGHTTGTGKQRDCRKDWLATQAGWRVIRWTPDMVTAENCKILCSIIYPLTRYHVPSSLVPVSK